MSPPSIKAQFAALTLALSVVASGTATALAGQAGTVRAGDLSAIHIDNFGRVTDSYYRGAEPNGEQRALAAFGIRTVIDLRGDDGDSADRLRAERAGMKYVRIPMTTHQGPTLEMVQTFLELVTDPANQPVYVHCVGGRHRTGVMTAIYRMTQEGWSADRAFTEMKQYKFGPDFLHAELKRFVYGFPALLAGTPSP